MAAPTLSIEVRWRVQGSGQPWAVGRYPPEASNITIPGLIRGLTYEGQARAIGPGGLGSLWVPITFDVADGNRTSSTALPPVMVGNVSSRWVSGTEISWSGTDTAITLSVTAGLLQVGDQQISYGASSTEITGTASEVRTVFLYYDDPYWEGGSRTLGVTTDSVASMAQPGRVLIDQLTVAFAASGGSSSGGGDIGGGGGGSGTGGCPHVDAWVIERTRGAMPAGEVAPGDWLRSIDPATGEQGWAQVTHSRRITAAGVRVRHSHGVLTCTREAPLPAPVTCVPAPDTAGAPMLARVDGLVCMGQVVQVDDAGQIPAQHISISNGIFWVGDELGAYLPHHNKVPYDPP